MNEPDIYLASSSPRRQRLLEQIGVRFEQVEVEIKEMRQLEETPEKFVVRMALGKARAGWEFLGGGQRPVLGADTVLAIDGEVLGKPRNREHGLIMLERLSGRCHDVLTGVALVGERERFLVQTSHVTFRDVTPAERIAYWDTGEPADKAGAYGIQGIGSIFIKHLEGSYSGVMGLPLFETTALLASFGIQVLDGV
ncbi:MAG: nucleoside triphosphate pyrophosphatase [Gammaproteobacteria bacterium]